MPARANFDRYWVAVVGLTKIDTGVSPKWVSDTLGEPDERTEDGAVQIYQYGTMLLKFESGSLTGSADMDMRHLR